MGDPSPPWECALSAHRVCGIAHGPIRSAPRPPSGWVRCGTEVDQKRDGSSGPDPAVPGPPASCGGFSPVPAGSGARERSCPGGSAVTRPRLAFLRDPPRRTHLTCGPSRVWAWAPGAEKKRRSMWETCCASAAILRTVGCLPAPTRSSGSTPESPRSYWQLCKTEGTPAHPAQPFGVPAGARRMAQVSRWQERCWSPEPQPCSRGTSVLQRSPGT